MPKILESIREQLLETARKQIERNGYAKTTIRSVAAECQIAVGTVYNYFPSKDMLIATFVSEDWRSCMDAVAAHRDDDAKTRLKRIYDALCVFTERYRTLFSDADAEQAYRAAFSQRHRQLREQLAVQIEPICADGPDRRYCAEFIAESLLVWTLEGKPFEDIYQILQRLIKTESEESSDEQL